MADTRSNGTAADSDAEIRTLRPASGAKVTQGLKPHYENSWAIVIGINRYQADGIRDLDYPVSDGDGMARLLLGPLGFAAERMFVVLDPPPVEELPYRLHAEHATKAVIEDLLFTRLPDLVGPDDRILIFFAGHGERRGLPSGAEEMGYLVPSDAQPMQWHTYIDLEAVTRAGNLCAAKHVFYLLDACYSGLATARAEVRERRYEEGMLTSRARQVLTAGTAKQAVADKGPSGHSLFTWYVLQGLRGEADLFQNGVITGSQLMVHVRDRVARDFGSEQTPDFGALPGHESGGDFVFVEPEFSSDEHFELGCDLLDAGRRLGDMGRFAAAARELEMAVQSTSKPRPEALGMLGRAQFAAGNVNAAVASFRHACDLGDSRSLLHLGMARAKQRRYEEAIEALLAFSQQHPSDTDAGWAADFAAVLKRTGGGRRCGLLIGVGMGSEEDLRALREVMVRRLGFRSRDIVTLVDEQATLAAILDAFGSLTAQTCAADTVLVYLSGVGTQLPNTRSDYPTTDGRLSVLLPADYRKGLLWEYQVLDLMSHIPATDKLLIADASHFAFLPAQSRHLGFRFISGCGRNQVDYVKRMDGKWRGEFGYYLVQHLDRNPSDTELSFGELVKRVDASRQVEGSGSRSVAIGSSKAPVFPREAPDYLWLYEFALRRDHATLSEDEIAACREMLETPQTTTFADANLALAEALQVRGSIDPAIQALDRAQANGLRTAPEALLLRARTLVQARQYQPARAVLQTYAEHGADLEAELASSAETLLQLLASSEKHALLVAIGQYANPKLPCVRGAANDARAVRRLLVDRFGFRADDIVLLKDEQASREAIVQALESLARYARNLPAFFYFSGLGSVDADGLPVLLAADARQEGVDDLALTLLQELAAAGGDNLVSLIDAGFAVESNDPRFVDPAPGAGFWYWGQETDVERQRYDRNRVGGLSIFPASLRQIKGGNKPHRRVTYKFIELCSGSDAAAPSRGALRAGLLEAKLTVLGGVEAQPLFANLNAIAQVEAQLTDMAHWPLKKAEKLLEKLLHCRRGADWQVLLELGAVRHLLGHQEPALEALQEAARLLESADMAPIDAQRARVDAHYYAGCSLLGHGQYATAVSQFELALAGDPRHAKAHLYHGQALQKLIELDLYQQIEQTWTAYLKLGAPLGHESEIRAFVDQRRPQTDKS